MANKFLKAAGGNWTAAATWSATDASGVDDAGPPTAADDCFAELLSGNVTISAASTGKSFSTTGGVGSWGGTLTHNAFVWTVAGSITFNSGITYTPLATSTVTLSATNTLTSVGKLFPLMILNTGITTTLGDNLSFMESKVITLTLNGDSLDINGKTVAGNSAINRLFIISNTYGTARTITTTTGSFDAADFQDITASTAINLSAVTNYAGDAGGNTNITFTTAANQTYTGGAGNWSTGASWTSRVPLPQDDVFMSGVTGGTITMDMPRVGKTISWLSAAGTPTWAITVQARFYGGIVLITAMNVTNSTVSNFFEGRGFFTLTSAGKNFSTGSAATTFQNIGGGMQLLDAAVFSSSSSSAWTLNSGTFDANDFNINSNSFSTLGILTRQFLMGNGTWTATGSDSVQNPWRIQTTTGLTMTPEGSTILFTDVGSNIKTFRGGSLTYNNFNITGGGTGSVNITGANTFANLPQIVGGTKTLKYTAATTTTYTGGTSFGNGANIITISSVTAATHTLTKSSGTISGTSLNLTNSIATGGAAWYAGATPPSVDNGGNTGWIFTAAPSGGGVGGFNTPKNLGSLTPLATALY